MADEKSTTIDQEVPETREGNESWWERHTHVAPRIDDDRYQAEVGEFSEEVAEVSRIMVPDGKKNS